MQPRSPDPGAPARTHAAILGIGAYRPSPGGPQRRDLRRRSTPATSGSSSAPASSERRWAADDETVADDVGRGRPQGARARRHRRRARSTASSSPPSPTSTRPRPSPPRSPTSSAPTSAAAFDISAACAGLLPRHRDGRPTCPQRQRQATCWSSASSGSPTSPTATTAARRSSSPTAPAPPCRTERDAGHRPGRLGLRRRAVRPDPADARTGATWSARPTTAGVMPHLRDGGQPGLPLGVLHDGQDRPAGARRAPASRADDLDVFVPAPGQHAHHRRDGPRS